MFHNIIKYINLAVELYTLFKLIKKLIKMRRLQLTQVLYQNSKEDLMLSVEEMKNILTAFASEDNPINRIRQSGKFNLYKIALMYSQLRKLYNYRTVLFLTEMRYKGLTRQEKKEVLQHVIETANVSRETYTEMMSITLPTVNKILNNMSILIRDGDKMPKKKRKPRVTKPKVAKEEKED